MLQGVSANLVTSPSSIESPLVVYQPMPTLIKPRTIKGAKEIVLQ
jgi:hypothetical protein